MCVCVCVCVCVCEYVSVCVCVCVCVCVWIYIYSRLYHNIYIYTCSRALTFVNWQKVPGADLSSSLGTSVALTSSRRSIKWTRHTFSKSLGYVPLFSTCPRALTFENFEIRRWGRPPGLGSWEAHCLLLSIFSSCRMWSVCVPPPCTGKACRYAGGPLRTAGIFFNYYWHIIYVGTLSCNSLIVVVFVVVFCTLNICKAAYCITRWVECIICISLFFALVYFLAHTYYIY